MTRGSDPGEDFGDQWNDSRQRGREKADRGESHWAEDKYLKRNNERLSSGPAHHAKSEGCADKTVVLLAALGGIAWFLSEAVQRVA